MTLIDQAQPHTQGPREKVIAEYEILTRQHNAQGPFLEIMHGQARNAISPSAFLKGEERHVVGRGKSGDIDDVHFHNANPNDMSGLFESECFSTVIWDRALERDAAFWLTLAEIKRVLKPAGTLIVCTCCFTKANKFGIKVVGAKGNDIPALTPTKAVDATVADYWRISAQSMRKAILNGFDIREVRMSFTVPHLFGVGVKQA